MNTLRLTTIILSLILLAACGGGGGGGASGSPVITPAQISSALHEIAGQEDDVLVLENEPSLRTRDQFLPLDNAELVFEGRNNGMKLFRFGGPHSTNTDLIYSNFGGWDGDVVFGYHALYQVETDVLMAENYYVYGVSSNSRPQGTGPAVWRGASIGYHTVSDGTETAWGGNVVLRIDNLNSPMIDINVNGLGTSSPEDSYPELVQATASVENIPLSMEGTFTSTGDNGEWHGGFYGENHSHVGGVFRQDALAGAFGARRVD